MRVILRPLWIPALAALALAAPAPASPGTRAESSATPTPTPATAAGLRLDATRGRPPMEAPDAPALSPRGAAPLPLAPTTTPQAGGPYWRPLTVVPRLNHSAVYDPVRGRVIVLMGSCPTDFGFNSYLFDAQALTLGPTPQWSPLAFVPLPPLSGPYGRENVAAIYDEANDRVLVHGGLAGGLTEPSGWWCTAFDELWELSLSPAPRWSQIQVAGPAPCGRYAHAGLYDPVRKRVLLFGGTTNPRMYCTIGAGLNDLWELSVEGTPAWREVAQSGDIPRPGIAGSAFYDRARDRMLFVSQDSVWAMSLAPTGSWTRLETGSGPTWGTAALDAAGDRLVAQAETETWELPLAGQATWRRILAEGAPAGLVGRFSATWDPQGERLVLFGGSGPTGPWGDETWFIGLHDGARWEKMSRLGEPELSSHKLVFDPVRDRVLAIGGYDNPAGALALSPTNLGPWSALLTGDGPSGLVGHGAVYDGRRDRVLVHGGGRSSLLSYPKVPLNHDTWQLGLAGAPHWSLVPTGGGPARALFSMILDPRRDRLLLFGGVDSALTYHNDVWQLRLADADAAWERLVVPGTLPPACAMHEAVYDPGRDRMLVGAGTLADVWSLNLGGPLAWTLLGPGGPRHLGASLVYDPVRDQLVAQFGEYATAGTRVWPLASGTAAWEPLDLHCCGRDDFVPASRSCHAAVYDPVRDQIVVSGGYIGSMGGGIPWRDAWALVFGTPVRDVAIDIRPGSEENVVNPGANGVLPVAILSNEGFDATTIDPLSVKLAEAGVRVRPNGAPMAFRQDADGDGRADLVLHVESGELALAPGDTIAQLTGKAGSLSVRGRDHVRVVGGGVHAPKPNLAAPAASEATAPALLAVRCLPGSGLRVSLAMAPGASAGLDLLDIAGRRVRSLALDGGSGPREVKLGDGALSPGVYWVRLRQAGVVLTRKAVVLR